MTVRLHYHVPQAFVGGGERHLQYLIDALRRTGDARELSILVTYESDAVSAFVASLDTLRARVTAADELAAVLRDFEPDVIQFYASALVYRALGGLRHDPRVIEVIHTVGPVREGSWTYPKDRVDTLVCVSPHVRLDAWFRAPDAPVVVIPNGVDPARFRPEPGARAATPVVGFAGRLTPDKGIDTILELAPRLSCAVELVGRDFQGYRHSRVPNVAVLPETDHPEHHYRRWWAFLSASPREGFGLAITEALSAGCPPVTLRSGGITAYLRHGRDALIADSPEELVRHVNDVVEGRIALAPAPLRFSADDMARRYLELYRRPRSERRHAGRPAPTFRVQRDRLRVPGGALAVAPAGWYGVVRALAGICDAHAEPEAAIDAIDAHRPRVVVLGCFQEEWIPVCRHAHRRGATVVATWHAAYVLNEFDAINRRRMAALLDAYRAGDVDHLATPHQGLAASWTHYGFPTDYLPNLVDRGLQRQAKLPGIHIGVLGSGNQSWKNLECQIVAAGMVPGATIHVQSRQALPVIARLGIRVRRHLATLPDERYHALVGGMTVNLCVSLSESYSYLTAESFLMETPVLTSSNAPLIRAAGPDDGAVALCGTPHFDDPVAIRERIGQLIAEREVLGPRLRAHMLAVDRANREICERVVQRWT